MERIGGKYTGKGREGGRRTGRGGEREREGRRGSKDGWKRADKRDSIGDAR